MMAKTFSLEMKESEIFRLRFWHTRWSFVRQLTVTRSHVSAYELRIGLSPQTQMANHNKTSERERKETSHRPEMLERARERRKIVFSSLHNNLLQLISVSVGHVIRCTTCDFHHTTQTYKWRKRRWWDPYRYRRNITSIIQSFNQQSAISYP